MFVRFYVKACSALVHTDLINFESDAPSMSNLFLANA